MANKLSVAESKNAQGKELYKLGKYSNALYMYEIAINLCPNIAKYYGNRSACYLMIKNYVKAQAEAQKAVEIDPSYLKGYLRIVKCCLYDGNLKFALSTLKKAQHIFPEEETVLNQIEKVNLLQEHFQKYEDQFERKKYSEALNLIEKCLSEESNCTKFVLAKANCLIRLKEFEAAEKIADDILAMNKNDENAIFVKTCAQCYQQDVQSALSLLKKVKLQLPDHSKLNQLYTNTHLISNNIKNIENAIQNYSYEEAYKLTIKTLKIDPYYAVTNKRLHRRKIDIAQGEKKLHWNGIIDCDEFMDLYGEDLSILHIKVNLLLDLKKYDDAIEVYKKILKLENNIINNEILLQFERILVKENEYEKCIDMTYDILEYNPNNIKALEIRAKCNLELKEYDLAIEDYKTILRFEVKEGVFNQQEIERNLNIAEQKAKDEYDNYKILNLSRENITSSAIKEAYRNLAKIYHPDKSKIKSKYVEHKLTNKFIRLTKAKDILLKLYDK